MEAPRNAGNWCGPRGIGHLSLRPHGSKPTYRKLSKAADHIWRCAPREGIRLRLFLFAQDSKALEDRFLRIGQPLCSTKLADGTTVSLVSRLIDFDPSVLPNQQQMDGTAGRILSPEIKRLNDGEEVSGLTAMFWNAPKDGESLTLYEIGGVSLRRNPVPR
jgi:hypothetical protein